MIHLPPEPDSVSLLPAGANPWPVSVYDVRPYTQHVFSTTFDPRFAENALSLQGADGRDFVGHAPASARITACGLVYPLTAPLADGALFTPYAMEQKWALFLRAGRLIVVRSWLLEVFVLVDATVGENELTLTAIHGVFLNEDETPEFTVGTLDFILRTHWMDEPYPAPLPPEYRDDPEMAAKWCFRVHGWFARFASYEPFSG